MDDSRKERLKRVNINKIRPDGTYWTQNREGQFVTVLLRPEDIRFLRWYHNNPNIAYQVQLPVVNRRPSANVNTQKPVGKQVRVSRDQKYTKPKYRLKEPIRIAGKFIVIFGLVVCVATGSLLIKSNNEPTPTSGGAYVSMFDDSTTTTSNNGYKEIPTLKWDVDTNEEEETYEIERDEFIRLLCDVYQVDYNLTYSKLVEITDNFCDSEYLAGRNNFVTCKGMEIDADSEEEFLVYAVRIIAQDPNRVGLKSSEVSIDNGYDSGTDYVQMIAKWSKILGVDPALVYAIMRAETGFDSELLNESNNPAGLKDGTGNGFWVFPNKEAGLLELMMEIIKYHNMGAYTIEEIAAIHCPIDDPEDTYGLNHNWIGNVTSCYESGKEIFEEMGYYESNGLSY